jgi:broad specificity phosphatase PhoE
MSLYLNRVKDRGARVPDDSKRARLVNTSQILISPSFAYRTRNARSQLLKPSSKLLRQLNFGHAAGHPMPFNADRRMTFEEHAARGVYLVWYRDDDRFRGGERIKDLAERVNSALEKLVLPHMWQAAKEGKTGIHVAAVSLGLCIGELF